MSTSFEDIQDWMEEYDNTFDSPSESHSGSQSLPVSTSSPLSAAGDPSTVSRVKGEWLAGKKTAALPDNIPA
jgi:hypothetical protein